MSNAASSTTTFRLSSCAQATLGRGLAILVAGLGTAIALMLKAQFLPALVVLVVLWIVFFWPTTLAVGRDALRVSWLGTHRTIAYGELERATVYRTGGVPFGVELIAGEGRRIRVPVFRPAVARQQQILRTVLGAIATARTAAGFPPTAAAPKAAASNHPAPKSPASKRTV